MKVKRHLYFLLIFFTGSLTASIFEWLQPITTIEVKNVSPKVIKWLDIDYQGEIGDYQGRITENMHPGQTITFKWGTPSEASYRLHITFDDDTEVKGGRGYTSRGETVIDSVDSDSIMSQVPVMHSMGLFHHEPADTTYSGIQNSEQRKSAAVSK